MQMSLFPVPCSYVVGLGKLGWVSVVAVSKSLKNRDVFKEFEKALFCGKYVSVFVCHSKEKLGVLLSSLENKKSVSFGNVVFNVCKKHYVFE